MVAAQLRQPLTVMRQQYLRVLVAAAAMARVAVSAVGSCWFGGAAVATNLVGAVVGMVAVVASLAPFTRRSGSTRLVARPDSIAEGAALVSRLLDSWLDRLERRLDPRVECLALACSTSCLSQVQEPVAEIEQGTWVSLDTISDTICIYPKENVGTKHKGA